MHGLYHTLMRHYHDLGVLATVVNWIYVMVITKYQCTYRIGRKQRLYVVMGRLSLLL